jgi:hypothetical protein
MDGDAADIEFEIGRAPYRKCGDFASVVKGRVPHVSQFWAA